MTTGEVMAELEALGQDRYRQLLFRNYGVKEPCFGVKIGDLKKIQKRIGKDHALALELFATGNYDAMYLAGLIADDARMTKRDLARWVSQAYAGALPGSTVPWVAAGSPHGHEMARKWIESPKPLVAAAGWATLSCLVALKPDAELDLAELKQLIQHVKRTIADAPDAVRYQMNSFLICVGCYVPALTDAAIRLGEEIGPVTADLGDNNCQIPFAPEYIRKVRDRGAIGKKRKSVKC